MGPRDVHVWCRRTDQWGAAALEAALSTLSRVERDRAECFRFHADRRDYIAAHDLLRHSLSRYASTPPEAWEFDTEPGGRPVLRGGAGAAVPQGALTFSLSHTRGFVACAIARAAEVGVDVERTDRSIEVQELGPSVLSAGELAALRACDEASRPCLAVELWTLKEAYAKAIGQGLSAPLSAARFMTGEHGAIAFSTPGGEESARWQFAVFVPWATPPDVRLAVAVRRPNRAPWRVLARLEDEPARALVALRATR